ncbi:MAG: cell division protein FtsA [Candidatus Ornithospirochaeta sp.]|nr:cell division protein FtsA [Sphaerochaetaceae bacterium]MDD7162759.1 cell division protein FtsA [Sphaerochaetaceae bacterium]MDY5522888.1 cell division protein FtsA [Candidatus Ornithospirochaeta sp.]
MAADKTIVGLDIGTSSTRVAVGSVSRDGLLVIECVVERPSEGVKNGSIVNIEQTMKVIGSVIGEAEVQAGTEISSVIIGIGGDQIKGIKSNGVVGINSKDQEITKDDIRRSIDVARNIQLPQNTEILHSLVQDFYVDSRSGIKDPVDMLGHRLDTKILLVLGSSPIIQNQKKCVYKTGLQIQKVVFQTLADSEVVLSPEEKDMGVILIDIGSGSTNYIAYSSGAPVHVGGINRGSDLVTSDIAYLFQLPKAAAESLKLTDGSCFSPGIGEDEMIVTPSLGGKPAIRMPKKEFAKVIEARMAEILLMIQQDLQDNQIQGPFGAGIVLVGGGALMGGVTELAAEIFRLPARIGFPEAISGLDRTYIDPKYATVLGLFKSEAKKYRDNSDIGGVKEKKGFGTKMKNLLGKLF